MFGYNKSKNLSKSIRACFKILARVERLTAKVCKLTSGFQGNYQQTLVDIYRGYKTKGFRIGLYVLDLEDVFVRV